MGRIDGVGGVAIEYSDVGAGRPLVLVHGITESRHTWDPLVPMLVERGFRVLALDLRGHGSSGTAPTYDLAAMAGDLGALIAAERIDDALLVGHSLGGAVVTAFAAGGPCRGVINVDQPLALAGFKEGLGQLEPLLRGTPEEFASAISMLFDAMAGPLAGPERARVDALRHAAPDVVLGVWDLVLTASAAELDAVVDALATAVRVPYLSLHGIDPGPDYERWLTDRMGSATVEVWADHGHYPHLIDPDRFVARLAAFDGATT